MPLAHVAKDEPRGRVADGPHGARGVALLADAGGPDGEGIGDGHGVEEAARVGVARAAQDVGPRGLQIGRASCRGRA